MSPRRKRAWIVLRSIENADHDRCLDIFERPDGSFGFEEFRKDPEDSGLWTPLQSYSATRYASRELAIRAASVTVAWLDDAP